MAPAKPAARESRNQRHIRQLRAVLWFLLFLLLSLSGAVVSACVLGRSVYRWHGFAVELRLLPSLQGETELVLTPLGEVRAHTHRAPVTLIASLQEIQVDEIRKLLVQQNARDVITADFKRAASAFLRNFVLRQIAFAALGALLAPLLLRSRRPWKYFISPLLGVGIVGGTLASALMTFDGKAFESPTYTGALQQAPWVIHFARDAFVRIDELSQKLRVVAENLSVLYGRIEAPPDKLTDGIEPRTIRILHVSDIHNNPAAIEFMKEAARQFHVSFIIDTGDLTDFGSPPETVIVQSIAKIGLPYVFVAGNHDSRTVIDSLAKLPNVTVLNGSPVTLQGFSILGLANPASARAGVGSVDTTPAELQAGSDALLRTVGAMAEPPDILAIHNPEEARPLFGQVPLVLCGHLHRYYVETHGPAKPDRPIIELQPGKTPPPAAAKPSFTTVVCNAGTTGAAGLRYFEREQGVPFSCAVLTFQRPADHGPLKKGEATPQLRAIDTIVLDGALHQYSITHTSFSVGAGAR